MHPSFKKIVLINTVLIILTIFSIFYLDKPLVLLIHQSELDSINQLRYITEYLPHLLAFVVLIGIALNKNFTSWVQRIATIIYFCLSLYVTIGVKDLLKIFFGRYWPKTWIHNNLSLISNNIYGFNFFHGFNNMGSFPSGHSVYVTFCLIWFIHISSRFRLLFLFIASLVPLALIILDYHFLGDCLAGICLGLDFAFISIYLYDLVRNRK